MNDTQHANSSATGTTFTGLSDEERAAMKQRTQELKAGAPRPARGQGGRRTRRARQDRRDATGFDA